MQLVRALANPTRIRILSAIAERPTTPRLLAERIDESAGVIAYHVKVLRHTGCIQQVEPEQTSVAAERSYELAPSARPTQPLAPPAVAHSGPGHPPAALVQSALQKGLPRRGEDLFGARQDQLSCASIVVDKQGWQEISAAIGEALDRIWAAHEQSTRRLTDSEEEGINATIAVASFESSEPRAA